MYMQKQERLIQRMLQSFVRAQLRKDGPASKMVVFGLVTQSEEVWLLMNFSDRSEKAFLVLKTDSPSFDKLPILLTNIGFLLYSDKSESLSY